MNEVTKNTLKNLLKLYGTVALTWYGMYKTGELVGAAKVIDKTNDELNKHDLVISTVTMPTIVSRLKTGKNEIKVCVDTKTE